MNQNTQILKHLRKRPLTPLEALYLYGCLRLAARVNELRSQGNPIQTEIVRQGNKRFARYRLV